MMSLQSTEYGTKVAKRRSLGSIHLGKNGRISIVSVGDFGLFSH